MQWLQLQAEWRLGLGGHSPATNKTISEDDESFENSLESHVQGEGFTPVSIVFVLEMVFPILFGNSILPEERRRQKGDKPR